MSSKIGRNDLCPCGSGKKYKKCCLEKEEKRCSNKFSDLIRKCERADLMKTIAALQLIPQNHGKNIRLELIALGTNLAKTSGQKVEYNLLKKIFEDDFLSHHLEDPVSNFFTENIIFHGGNYIVFPGLVTSGTKILQTVLESIFLLENDLPEEVKTKIRCGIETILILSDLIASKAGIERYTFIESNESSIFIPEESQLMRLKNIVAFTEAELIEMLNANGIPFDAILNFVADTQDLDYKNRNPESNPFLTRPIVLVEGLYIFLLPSAIVSCLLSFVSTCIIDLSYDSVVQNYVSLQWKQLGKLLMTMNWQSVQIALPSLHPDLKIREKVLRFDIYKMVYVQYIEPKLFQQDSDVNGTKTCKNIETLLEERQKEILNHLKSVNVLCPYEYLILVVIGESGKNQYLSFTPPKDCHILTFPLNDLYILANSEEVNELTLWKFVKALAIAKEKIKILPFMDTLDLYKFFKDNFGSLLDNARSHQYYLTTEVGLANNLRREVLGWEDKHSILRFEKENLVYTTIKRNKDYAYIYIEDNPGQVFKLVIEEFPFPLWVSNYLPYPINEYVECVIFWMVKFVNSLYKRYIVLDSLPIEIKIELDEHLLSNTFPVEHEPSSDVSIEVNVIQRSIHVTIPFEIIHTLHKPHNQGERLILEAVLKGFNKLLKDSGGVYLKHEEIWSILDEHVPLSNAKMILIWDSTDDYKLDNRWLIPYRYIPDFDTSNILNHLLSYTGITTPKTSLKITNDKGKICNKIVSGLIHDLSSELAQYNAIELLDFLMEINEANTQIKTVNYTLIPARIACFSDFDSEVQKYLKNGKRLVSASLSVRCLIEFIAATPQFGNKLFNFDDIDRLMALMNEVIAWGMISDSINLNIDDPNIEILPSGRIQVESDFGNELTEKFAKAKYESEVYEFQEYYEIDFQSQEKYIPTQQDTDNAFLAEFGISMTKIMQIKGSFINLIQKNERSVMGFEESALTKEILENQTNITEEEILFGLNILSLWKRSSLTKAPKGFEQQDIYPWIFNRELSFVRRSIVKIVDPTDGKSYYYSGFRHLMASAENLKNLLISGRMKAIEKGDLDQLLSKINKKKGDVYRKLVYLWLKDTTLKVIEHEVTIDKKGHLTADKNWGDIDILAIDVSNKVIYSIECKDTVEARAIHEMKSEMDKYLGRNGNDGMIEKHVKRDWWLKENQNQLTKFIENPESFKIKSIVLTSNEIPIIYLQKAKLLLPMMSFKKLKRFGIELFKEI